ncbi:MAG TPA: UbiA family prenyltransferase, partial [Thermoleophilia bacterium]|nr:UbiA family prenyltransferase [Thermoleophilia bacterium]
MPVTAVESRPVITAPPPAAPAVPAGDAAPSGEAARARVSLGDSLRAYVALTKPRIIELLIVTTIPVMFLAQRGVPSLWLVVAVTVGGYLSAGSANALNCWVDRDIDAQMRRT